MENAEKVKSYIDELTAAGFSFDTEPDEKTFEINTGTGMMYAATNSGGLGVTLTYEKYAGFSITVTQAEPEED